MESLHLELDSLAQFRMQPSRFIRSDILGTLKTLIDQFVSEGVLISDISCTHASPSVVVPKKEEFSFEISTAPGKYQARMAHKVLEGFDLNEAVVYIDDTVVYGKDEASFLQMLDMVLDRMVKFNVQLKPSKCFFGMTSVEFVMFLMRMGCI